MRSLVLVMVLCTIFAKAEDVLELSDNPHSSHNSRVENGDEKLNALIQNPVKVITQSTEHFAVNFFKAVSSEKKNESLISSPLSAHVVLSMAAFGAGGNTAMQMRSALNLPNMDSVGHQMFSDLMNDLNNVKNVTLEMANKMYVAKNLELKSDFKQLTSGPFRSEVALLDVVHPFDAANTVNKWVNESTHGKIDKLIKEKDITSDTRMILLNAIYFKGRWAKPFDKDYTRNRPFYYMENNERKEKQVPSMHRHDYYLYGKLADLKARFVELPYENENFKMIIIVPDEIDGLNRIKDNFEAFNFRRLAKIGTEQAIRLYLPKFKIESIIELNSTLKRLGMTDMFTAAANFNGISNENLIVSAVRQKAYVEVNEEGSEAAAATGIVMRIVGGTVYNKEVKVDRPFAFTIIDSKNEVTLFAGLQYF